MKNANLALKKSIKQFKEELCKEFYQKKNITALTNKLVVFIDEVLLTLFHQNQLDKDNKFCLLALGGYGRRELQLHSDIDLLLLHSEDISKVHSQRAQAFIQSCWDIGLDVSHQITTVEACAELASNDLSVISSILDIHLIGGYSNLMEELLYKTHPLHMWPSDRYFFAKKQEQIQRYTKYGDTAYNLEPNVKNGPGGLRDIHILLNICKRHFGVSKFAEVIGSGFITDKEYEELIACQHFLWKVRFALHMLAGKQEERLLFDYQTKLASLFGFTDKPHGLAIEQFMKTYFKIIKRLRELNEMLLQWFAEAIIYHEKQQITPLDANFQLANDYIEVKHPQVFRQRPLALLELFLWMAKRPDIVGVRASTIRLIRENLHLFSHKIRKSQAATTCFLAIFKTAEDPFATLQHMNRYGILGYYLDSFAAVTGQMQYDLFHVYTVDQHTLFVIRNLTRFLKAEYAGQFPLAAQLMPAIKQREILYLAALFHDIAKGRGGDHSELGAEEAHQFACRHDLSEAERSLLVWLVRNHLLMSQTAQRQDIYDPKTVQTFCSQLPQTEYLDYLYLLTVADVCATNQKLWNTWRDSLLKELYRAAQFAMQEKNLLDEAAMIKARKEQAMKLLFKDGFHQETIESLWFHFKDKYFLHEPADVIARHTKAIINTKEYPLVLIMPHHSQGGTEVFIYMPHRDERFTITTTVLSNHYATIQEATILTCNNGYDLDTYIILNEQHQAFFAKERIITIQNALKEQLTNNEELPTTTRRRLSRTQAHFNLKPQISFSEDDQLHQTSLFLITTDRPGLLATISRIFLTLDINLHNAKIATFGERVEDMFFITTKIGNPLSKEEKEQLKHALIRKLFTENL
ncbi:[protein-PII] uridylyltransferase [Legionella jamestowniensis]|uniref:Bifunctional uridylyltransferase/uridylyl-removing enzyme n=1 Tax=Legionella jamestowniensis TaxID=455 RepID=A0A0W0UKG0_9GAMM|nr:[protein-PII] uridylyltransferase [Legionella jamestowniensis]KTD08118.1 protein-PII uridylyltransferase [Legionella jamestowniensis]SFM08987.1 UTP--GlnB (protein PII) uridylyltransferase, GlnD [Legionella jamestowniensis DSM 19215]